MTVVVYCEVVVLVLVEDITVVKVLVLTVWPGGALLEYKVKHCSVVERDASAKLHAERQSAARMEYLPMVDCCGGDVHKKC